MPTQPLTDTERKMLEFEAANTWWLKTGSRDAAIRAEFNMHPLAYDRAVLAMLRKPEAEALDPVTTRRLRNRVDARRGRLSA